jgi:RNA recognition motif-containing protein
MIGSTTYDLEEFFSEYGPVRSCFVVYDKEDENAPPPTEPTTGEAKQNRGFGFVQLYVLFSIVRNDETFLTSSD